MGTLRFLMLIVMTGTALAAPLTWTESMQGLDGGVVREISVDPKDPERALALVRESGVFQTTDGAKTWKAVALPASGWCRRLWRDPADPQTVFVGTAAGTRMSKDGGATWAAAEAAPAWYAEAPRFNAIAVSPADPKRVYGATSKGVEVSRDGGKTWTAAAELSEQGFPESIAPDPKNADTLVVGCEKAVVRSTDAGATWKAAGGFNPETAAGFGALSPDPSDPKRIYLNVEGEEGDVLHVSQDGGASFSAVTSAPVPLLFPLAVAPSKPERIYTGADFGVIRSDDAGKQWQRFDKGLTARDTRALVLHPTEAGTVYHVGQVGLARSTDAGATWTALPRPQEIAGPAALLIHPKEPNLMMLVGRARAAVSIDSAASWFALPRPPKSGRMFGAFDPVDGKIAYMQARPDEGDPLRVVTKDGGASWKAAAPLPVAEALALWPTSRTGLELCDDTAIAQFMKNPDKPVYRPKWLPAPATGPMLEAPALHVRAPSNPAVQYLVWSAGALARSADGGKTWAPKNGFERGCGVVKALAVDPDDPDRLYVAAETGLVLSTDGGETASFEALGNPTGAKNVDCVALAVVPVKPRQLLVATPGRVYRATIVEPLAK